MKYIWIVLVSILMGCGGAQKEMATEDDHGHSHEGPDAHAHGADDAHAEDEAEGEEAALTAIQMQKIGLKLGPFEQKNLSATIKVNGTLEIPPQNRASVSTLMEGRITRIFVRPGQFIKKGGALASIQNPDFIDWQQQLAEIEGELLFLEKEYERQKKLLEKNIAAKKHFEKIESERAIAKARKKAFTAKLKLIGMPIKSGNEAFGSSIIIRSPLGGFVRDISVNTGAYVMSNQQLFEVVDNHHIHIDLKVFEKDLPLLKIGQPITFSLQSNPSQVMQANIFAIGKALEEKDRTVTVHAEMTNKNNQLLPGMYVEARIETERKSSQSLPESAITYDKGLTFIFVKEEVHEDETHFMRIQVLTGSRDIGYVEVTPLEELEAGAEVVIEGAYYLMAQTKKDEGGGGHHH